MATSSTTFGKSKQPSKRRGKSERTKILEAMSRAGKTEEGFYDELVARAENPDDNFTFKELMSRLSPIPKAVAPTIKFDLDENGTISQKAEQIIVGISKGNIPPDLGNQLIVSMSSLMNIKEKTEFEDRLKAIEDASKQAD
tara:strand:- start:186 stop:608 length:423 start_codon:yes stop_codon:yes gene_type:complete